MQLQNPSILPLNIKIQSNKNQTAIWGFWDQNGIEDAKFVSSLTTGAVYGSFNMAEYEVLNTAVM